MSFFFNVRINKKNLIITLNCVVFKNQMTQFCFLRPFEAFPNSIKPAGHPPETALFSKISRARQIFWQTISAEFGADDRK